MRAHTTSKGAARALRRATGLVALGATAVAVSLAGGQPAAAAPTGAIINAAAADAVKDSYIVVLKDNKAGTEAVRKPTFSNSPRRA